MTLRSRSLGRHLRTPRSGAQEWAAASVLGPVSQMLLSENSQPSQDQKPKSLKAGGIAAKSWQVEDHGNITYLKSHPVGQQSPEGLRPTMGPEMEDLEEEQASFPFVFTASK